MPYSIKNLLDIYTKQVESILGGIPMQVILYGSYARGEQRGDSDIDIIILVDLTDDELKKYSTELSYMTYDFNMDHNVDIKPILKSRSIFDKWKSCYPFYANIQKEGVVIHGVA